MVYPNKNNKLIQAAGEAVTPAGNAQLVCFGSDHDALVLPLEPGIEEIIDAMKALDRGKNIEVKRLVFHDWRADEFARGAWSSLPVGMARKISVLRQVVEDGAGVENENGKGKIWLANSDWASGWRGFIDGAIEEGTRAAKGVIEGLRAQSPETGT